MLIKINLSRIEYVSRLTRTARAPFAGCKRQSSQAHSGGVRRAVRRWKSQDHRSAIHAGGALNGPQWIDRSAPPLSVCWDFWADARANLLRTIEKKSTRSCSQAHNEREHVAPDAKTFRKGVKVGMFLRPWKLRRHSKTVAGRLRAWINTRRLSRLILRIAKKQKWLVLRCSFLRVYSAISVTRGSKRLETRKRSGRIAFGKAKVRSSWRSNLRQFWGTIRCERRWYYLSRSPSLAARAWVFTQAWNFTKHDSGQVSILEVSKVFWLNL